MRRVLRWLRLLAPAAAALWAVSAAAQEAARPFALPDPVGALAAEMRTIRTEWREIAAAIEAHEAEQHTTGAALRALDRDHERRRAAYRADRRRLAALLAPLALLARAPPESSSAPSEDRAVAAHHASVIEYLVPVLADRAAEAEADIDRLARSRTAQAARLDGLNEAKSLLTREQAGLQRLLLRKSSALALSIAARREPAVLGPDDAAAGPAIADTPPPTELAALPPPPDTTDAPQEGPAIAAISPGGARWPTAGSVRSNFGEAGEAGGRSQGIAIETSPGAQVVAPGGGRIVFAGPFRSYGRLLIIEHDDGYHSLMSGFGRIDGQVGDRVAAGNPVGEMPAEAENGAVLYVEVRRDGQPVDPIPWLLSDDREVRG